MWGREKQEKERSKFIFKTWSEMRDWTKAVAVVAMFAKSGSES